MDSMRSLNSSLPRSSPHRKTQQQGHQQPPEDLLSAFKAAALSVTTLYKSAASLEAPARAAGYQDALTDLITFLDQENLGLGDGEGWSVRQWATERLDGGNVGQNDSEEEEDDVEDVGQAEQVPVDEEQKEIAQQEDDLSSSIELPAKEATPEVQAHKHTTERQKSPSATSNVAFTFRGNQPSTNHDRDTNMDGHTESQGTAPPVRFEPSIRSNRPRHHRQFQQRTNNSTRSTLGSGAGSKRRFPLGDFFDLSGINFEPSKDSSDRGNKRSRHA